MLFTETLLILASTGGSEIFSSRWLFSIESTNRWPFMVDLGQVWLFSRQFMHYLVHFYLPKLCGSVPKLTNMRCEHMLYFCLIYRVGRSSSSWSVSGISLEEQFVKSRKGRRNCLAFILLYRHWWWTDTSFEINSWFNIYPASHDTYRN